MPATLTSFVLQARWTTSIRACLCLSSTISPLPSVSWSSSNFFRHSSIISRTMVKLPPDQARRDRAAPVPPACRRSLNTSTALPILEPTRTAGGVHQARLGSAWLGRGIYYLRHNVCSIVSLQLKKDRVKGTQCMVTMEKGGEVDIVRDLSSSTSNTQWRSCSSRPCRDQVKKQSVEGKRTCHRRHKKILSVQCRLNKLMD